MPNRIHALTSRDRVRVERVVRKVERGINNRVVVNYPLRNMKESSLVPVKIVSEKVTKKVEGVCILWNPNPIGNATEQPCKATYTSGYFPESKLFWAKKMGDYFELVSHGWTYAWGELIGQEMQKNVFGNVLTKVRQPNGIYTPGPIINGLSRYGRIELGKNVTALWDSVNDIWIFAEDCED